MTEKDKRELVWIEKRIAYNNTWPKAGTRVPKHVPN